ncbi:MAG: response regulator [Gammaproteobacteria bacterium]|nr:response regulator [Gammaproteobacteria bacterium]
MTRVLIVDDKQENRYLLRVLLQRHGCEVVAAHDGSEALAIARRAPPELVISDRLMPVVDGFTLLRQWKLDGRLQPIPVVVYTATYTDPRDEQLAPDLGADACIVEPAEPGPFMARILEVLADAGSGALPPDKQPQADEPVVLRESARRSCANWRTRRCSGARASGSRKSCRRRWPGTFSLCCGMPATAARSVQRRPWCRYTGRGTAQLRDHLRAAARRAGRDTRELGHHARFCKLSGHFLDVDARPPKQRRRVEVRRRKSAMERGRKRKTPLERGLRLGGPCRTRTYNQLIKSRCNSRPG